MEEWKEYKLEDIAEILTGPFGSQLHNEDYTNIGTPIVTVEHLGNRRFSRQNLPLISDYDKKRLSKYTLQNGDIVFSRVGSVDRCSYVTSTENDWLFSGRCLRVRCNNNCHSLFIYYYFCNVPVKQYIKSIAVGATMPSINTRIMSEIPILLPKFEKQKRIVDILSSLDDKIELNRRINENLEQQAQALFKSWFIDFEPFKDGKFIDSELGRMPKGWKVGTIGDYCKIRSGFAFKSSWWTERGVKIVKIKNISSSGILNMDDCSYVSKENVSKAKEFSLKSGDILIAMTGATIGKFCLVPALKEEMYVNQRVGKFFLGENPIMKIPFIHGLLKCENIISQIINKGQGSAQPNISGNDIETIPIIYPPEDIILKYNELVSPYFSMIIENISACDFISQLRDTLLPRLMSGKLEIKDNSYD